MLCVKEWVLFLKITFLCFVAQSVALSRQMHSIVFFTKRLKFADDVDDCLWSTVDLTFEHSHESFYKNITSCTRIFLWWDAKNSVGCTCSLFGCKLDLSTTQRKYNTSRESLNINDILKDTVIAIKGHKKLDCDPTVFSSTISLKS